MAIRGEAEGGRSMIIGGGGGGSVGGCVRGGLITPKSRIPSYTHTYTERERESQSHIALIIHTKFGCVHNRFQTCKWLEFGMPFYSISMVNVTGQGI
jgi:hypothetical protein